MDGSGEKYSFSHDFNAVTEETFEFPFTEPLVATSLQIDGISVNITAGMVRFIGWQRIEPLSKDTPGERRVVVRFAMNEYDARALKTAIGWALRDGH